MIPAMPVGPFRSQTRTVSESRLRSTPSSVVIVSPAVPVRTISSPPGTLSRSNACSGRLRVRMSENDDSRGVLADLQLGLGEDHPVRLHAAQLRLAELAPVGQHGAGQRDRDQLLGGDVGGAADDRPGPVAGLDL